MKKNQTLITKIKKKLKKERDLVREVDQLLLELDPIGRFFIIDLCGGKMKVELIRLESQTIHRKAVVKNVIDDTRYTIPLITLFQGKETQAPTKPTTKKKPNRTSNKVLNQKTSRRCDRCQRYTTFIGGICQSCVARRLPRAWGQGRV